MRSSWLYLAIRSERDIDGHTVRTRHRTSLDLTRVRSYGDVGDRRILGLTRAVRRYRGIACTVGHFDGVERLGERTDLVYLDEDRVGAAHFDTLLQEFDVRYEEVVADKLALAAELCGEQLPAFPVVLRHTVLDRVDGIFGNQALEVLDLLLEVRFAPFSPSKIV